MGCMDMGAMGCMERVWLLSRRPRAIFMQLWQSVYMPARESPENVEEVVESGTDREELRRIAKKIMEENKWVYDRLAEI